MSVESAVKLIRGKKGTEVRLTIYRDGKVGVIEKKVYYEGIVDKVVMKLATNKDFLLYVNNQYCNEYQKSASEIEASEYTVTCTQLFNPGENTLRFVSKI